MNKKIGLFLVMVGASGTAFAQNSVTLYGIVDEGLAFNSNAAGHRQYALVSGIGSGSRWGLKGTEALGGGTSAIFTLEGGFNTSTGALGQNGDLFGRQVFVGLTSTNLGTLTLGRQYPTGYDYVGPLSAGGDWAAAGAAYGAHPGDLDNLDGSFRINNAVKYKSPTIHGTSFGAIYSLGGVAGNYTRNQIYSLGAGYSGASANFGVGYTFIKNPNFSLFGNKANDSVTGSNMSGPVYSAYSTAGSQQIIAVGGNYIFGGATVGAVYSNTRFGNLGTTAVSGLSTPAFHGDMVFNIFEVNAKYAVTPTLQAGLAYSYTKSSSVLGKSGAKYNQVDAGLNYFVSKRTDLYADAIYQVASGHDSTGGSAVASIAFATPASTNHQLVSVVGIRHRF